MEVTNKYNKNSPSVQRFGSSLHSFYSRKLVEKWVIWKKRIPYTTSLHGTIVPLNAKVQMTDGKLGEKSFQWRLVAVS